MEDKILQFQAQMTGCRLGENKSLFLSFHTQEDLTDEARAKIQNWHRDTGWLTFSVPKIAAESITALPKLDPDEGKSPSQRLRAALFVLWTQRGKQDDFEMFYRIHLERFINVVKNKLT